MLKFLSFLAIFSISIIILNKIKENYSLKLIVNNHQVKFKNMT